MRILRSATTVTALSVAVLTGLGSAAAVTNLPSGATLVSVTAGANHTGINAPMHPAGAIAGKLTSARTGHAISAATVFAINAATHAFTYGMTGADGSFRVKGLRAGKYYLCSATYPASQTFGFVNRCFGSTAQYVSTPPTGSIQIQVTTGGLAANKNLALPDAGGISGIARSVAGSKPVGNVYVFVFHNGVVAGSGSTSTQSGSVGTYKVVGLAPGGGYKVCFNTAAASGGGSSTGYLSQCWNRVAWSGSGVPGNARVTSVTADHATANINALLNSAGAISGTVRSTAAGHHGIADSSVVVYRGGSYVTATGTLPSGAYKVVNLPAGTYKVCAIGGNIGSAPTTYGGRCWVNVVWNGRTLPGAAAGVVVHDGANHSGINLMLPPVAHPTGAIAGTVTYLGTPLQYVSVIAFDSSGSPVGSASTAADGTYRIAYLTPGSGYRVCFDPLNGFPASGTKPDTGYAAQCFHGVAWGAGEAAPVGQTLAVTAGATHTGVDAAITNGGEISGTVAKAGTTTGVSSVEVLVLNAAHKLVRTGYTGFDGTYTVPGVTPNAGGYTVCFAYSSFSFEMTPSTGYLNQCYNDKDWNGTP